MDSLGSMRVVFKTRRLAPALAAFAFAALAFGLAGCGGKRSLVLVDRAFAALSPDAARAYAGFAPPGSSSKTVVAPSEGAAEAIRSAFARVDPDYVLATPALLPFASRAAAERTSDGKTLVAALASFEPSGAATPDLVAFFETERAYRALGTLLARAVSDYDASHADRSYCGVLFVEHPTRPSSLLAAFRDAYERDAPPESLALRTLPASFQPDQLERVFSELETYNLSAVFVCPAGLVPGYRRRFPRVPAFEDPGDFYYPAPVQRKSADTYVLVRDPRLAVRALEKAAARGDRGRIPVPVGLEPAAGTAPRTRPGGLSATSFYKNAY